jgi:outer membrane protein assembly complex protein YaeT
MVSAVALRWSLVSTWLGVPTASSSCVGKKTPQITVRTILGQTLARLLPLVLMALAWIPLQAGPEQYEGKTIASIQFEPEKQPLTNAQLLALIPLRAGQPLRAADVRDAIQRLYATGDYAEIAVDATLGAGGVIVKLVTKPSFFIGHVAVKGVPEPPNQGQLVVATQLQLGAEYSEAEMQRAVDRLVAVVRRNGFHNASVKPSTSFDAASQQVTIDFAIDPGKRAKYDGVSVSGKTERSTDSIIHSTGWKRFFGIGWRPQTENRTQSGVVGVRSWYEKHNRLLAKVTLVKLDYHPATNTITPELSIDSGPEVDVRVRGAKVSAGKLRSLLPIYEERAVDKDLLMEGTRDLAAYFQSQGFFDASVTYNIAQAANGDQLIDYQVEKGARHKIVKLEIEGNKFFDDDTIRERMTVVPASLIRYRHGRYSQQYLARDLNAIRDLYRANGFRDVEVTSKEVDNFAGKTGQIAIFIEVNEGPQWFVSKLALEGAPAEDRPYLLSILHSTEGQAYSDLSVANDRDSVLEYYYNNGYPAAKFEFTSEPAEQPNQVNLKFMVDLGRRVYVRDVLISGLERTKGGLVSQRISIKPGDALSQNQITGSQRRLYDLGIFAKVSAAIQNPEGEEPTKYVLYSFEEAGRYLLNTGFGAEIGRIGGGSTSLDSPAGTTGFSPRVSFGISRLNFLGLGHTIGLQMRVSTLEQRALATYLAPQFQGNPNLNLQFSGLFDISHDVRTFSARREEGSIQLGQKLTKANSVQYRYTFRKVNVIGTPLVTPELIPRLSQPERVGSFSGTFIQERRDDPLDAHRGIYTTVDLALASSAFGSQTGFARVVARNATYYKLTKTLVLARTTSFGLIKRYAGLPDIPLAERFFAGGSTSNRAFPDNQAGPRDLTTGFPIGGGALFTNTVELRFPLIGDNIGGVLFNDMGNVYSSWDKISLRYRQNGLKDFDYAVQAIGFGIRYRTPIGPVRGDFSLSPNSPRFFGFKGTTDQLLFGGGQQVVQRINVFQFHFSLGQAF